MTSLLSVLPVGISSYAAAGIATALVIAILSRPSELDGIPTVGSNGWLSSWLACLRSLSPTSVQYLIHEGYKKHKLAPFKIAEPLGWLVVFSSREHIEDMRNAPSDTLSFSAALNDRMYIEYTMGPEIYHNQYHTPVLRSQLTRNIAALYPEVRDEIITALDDTLDLNGNEWKSIPAFGSMQKIVCRVANRVFVGLPLCRDPRWIDLNLQYPFTMLKAVVLIMLSPGPLKPIVARFLTNIEQCKKRARALAGPTIEERLKYLNEYGKEWADKPNDVLSWFMDGAQGSELSVESLAMRILSINLGAVNSSSIAITHALMYLAANPEYIKPLREEVEGIVEKEGWSKASVDKMRKTDSFLKECQRIKGNGNVDTLRKALKDFVFSDGTIIPKGTLITTAARCIHHDESVYKNANAFEPFRFADLREEDGEGAKHQFASTSPEYLPFGHGRYSCPGRFFAANVLKSMLAYVVVTYDIKLENDADRPKSTCFATDSTLPDPRAKIMFRKRAV